MVTAAAAWSVPVGTAQAAINTGATALQLAQALTTDPTVVVGASFVAKPPSGTPTAVADTPLAGFPVHGNSYAILSTGNAGLAANLGSTVASVDNGGGHVRGDTDTDVTILKVDINVPPGVNCFAIGYLKLLADQFSIPAPYTNDAFIAELDVSTWTTSGGTIYAPTNFARDANGEVVSVNSIGTTPMYHTHAAGTVYTGATAKLSAATPITPGNHSIYFSIFDQGDRWGDSAIFLDDFKLSTVRPGSCAPGVSVPLGVTKTADAAVSAAGMPNGYTITVSNPNATPVQLNSIYDDLPEGFAYRPRTTTGVTDSDPSIFGRHLTWPGPFTIPAGANVSLHFGVAVSTAVGTYYNTAGGEAGAVNVNAAVDTAPVDVVAGRHVEADPAIVEVGIPTTAYAFTLRARLREATGAPFAGVVVFLVGRTFLCAVQTGPSGEALCNGAFTANWAGAVHMTFGQGYTATYSGNGSSDSAPLLVVLGGDVP